MVINETFSLFINCSTTHKISHSRFLLIALLHSIMSVARDKTFLNYFYDLASDDKSVRLNAANLLVVHIKNSLKNKQPSDSEYALKRLVRGLASSRESARQGFATCLCELLVLPEMDLSVALDILDENTKVIRHTTPLFSCIILILFHFVCS